MDEINIFAQRLKEARMKAGLSQAELSRRTGVAPATLSSYEVTDSSKKPTMEKVILIAKALNVSLDWLCGLTDSPVNEPENNELIIDCELLLRVIAKFATDSPEPSVFVQLFDIEELGEYYGKVKVTYAAFNNKHITEFVQKIMQLQKLKNDGILVQDVFDGCIEQLILKTSKDIKSRCDELPF